MFHERSFLRRPDIEKGHISQFLEGASCINRQGPACDAVGLEDESNPCPTFRAHLKCRDNRFNPVSGEANDEEFAFRFTYDVEEDLPR
jgi:hypothetical protein